MRDIKEYLLDLKYWEDTLNKMILKQGFNKDDKVIIYDCMYIYREDIVTDLMNGTYKWSIPRKVEIAKDGSKKKRVVYVYDIKDRYVLGVLYRAVSDFYAERLSNACFSYKKETSTNDAILYLKKALDEKNVDANSYKGVKVDIHAYFNSVSRNRVIDMINELFDGGLKVSIENLMLDDRVISKGKIINEWKSLIPGCAFGSFFANYCLTDCDNYFVSQNKIYARYSDDIIVLEETDVELQEDLDKISWYLGEYGLEMNPDKYTWFSEQDDFEYLGLKLCCDGKVDISNHAKQKIKSQIHRWCRKGRMEIERDYKPFEKVAKGIIHKFNNKNMFCVIDNDASFGWCHYAFRYITTIESLKEIDFYMKDSLRALKTGKHNKANARYLNDEELKELGWVSLVDMFMLYKSDFDYYMEIVELMKNS